MGPLDGGGAPSPFLRACRNEAADRTPLWLMRQAGRYLPEYRQLRVGHPFLEMCHTPELAAEVTLQPLRRFDLDAAIIFADILLPLVPMGLDLAFVEDEGPRIGNPIREKKDVLSLRPVDAKTDLGFVLEAIGIVRAELGGKRPVIGFAGAPFTLASYAVEGGPTRDYRRLKALMWNEPEAYTRLMERLADVTVDYLLAQVTAGADALQLFDSWAGALSERDYREKVLPFSRSVISRAREAGVPVIHFAPGTGGYLETVAEAGGDVLSLDWRVDIGEARHRIGKAFAVQGNLDPMVLLEGSPKTVREAARAVLHAAGGRPGHIFNLGHGIHKETPIPNVEILIETVHTFSP